MSSRFGHVLVLLLPLPFKEDMKSIEADFYVVKSYDLTELKEKIAKTLETS